MPVTDLRGIRSVAKYFFIYDSMTSFLHDCQVVWTEAYAMGSSLFPLWWDHLVGVHGLVCLDRSLRELSLSRKRTNKK